MPAAEAADEAAAAPYCGACRTLRRRCAPGCIFAPYFSSSDFAAVHGVFGASNVSKMLEDISSSSSSSSSSPDQRALAAATLIAEARARARDPAFGRLSYLGILQEVLQNARRQVDDERDQIAREFGARAAAEKVDVAAAAAADPAAWVEARAQVAAALKHAREQDERLRGVRVANEVRWRELQQQKQKQPAAGTVGKQQMAAAAAVTGEQHEETAPPRVQEAMRSGQTPAAARQQRVDSAGDDGAAGRTPGQGGGTSVLLEAMMHLAGAGEHEQQQDLVLVAEHGENEHGITVGGHGHGNLDGVSSQEILQFQEFLDMAELARNRRKQQQQQQMMMMMMKDDDVTMEMQQITADTWQMEEASAATGNEMSQQFAWAQQQQYQYHDPAQAAAASEQEQDMLLRLQQHLVATAAELQLQSASARHQFDSLAAQHDDTALTRWYGFGGHTDMHQQAAVLAEQQGMVAQHAEEQVDMNHGHGGGQQPGAETDAMMQELAGVVYPAAGKQGTNRKHGGVMVTIQRHHHHQQQQQKSPEDAKWLKVQEMLEQIEQASSSAPELFAKRLETMARQAEARHAQREKDRKLETAMRQFVAAERAREQETMARHGETQLDNMNLVGQHGGHGRDDEETQAMMQELADFLEHGAVTRTQQDGMMTMTMMQQQEQQCSDDAAWVKVQEMLEELEEASSSSPEFAKRLDMLARQAEARHAQNEKDRKLEMAMRKFVAAARAREQEELMITQQQQAAAAQQQYSGTEQFVGVSPLGQGQQPYWQHQPTVNGEHGTGGASNTMAFLTPGFTKDDARSVLVGQQQPQPNGDQMDSSLPPLPPSLGQLSHQQTTDGGGQGMNSDLAAYLHYESLSRHGLANNFRFQQG